VSRENTVLRSYTRKADPKAALLKALEEDCKEGGWKLCDSAGMLVSTDLQGVSRLPFEVFRVLILVDYATPAVPLRYGNGVGLISTYF
jgi:hypothetical protein